MPKYVATRIRHTAQGWSVQAQMADKPHDWVDLHIYKNLYPSHDPMTKVIRSMAKNEACALAQSLSKDYDDDITCYDESGYTIVAYRHGRPRKEPT